MTFEGVQTVGNKLIVHIPQRLEDTIVVAGKKLYFDGEFNEHFHKKLAGVVVGAPARLGDEYLFSKRGLVDKNQPCSAIQDVLEVGDVVYLDWTVLEKGFEVPDENGLYWCKANQVVARVREGRLIPYGSYALLREVWPDEAQPVQVGGHEVRLPLTASGLVLSTAEVEPLRYQGEVVHVGLPLRGQPQRVWPGDRVLVDKRVCSQYTHLPLKMKMEGEEYLCVRQDYIEAVIEPPSQAVDGEEVHYIKGVAEDKCLVDELLAMGAIARFTRTN